MSVISDAVTPSALEKRGPYMPEGKARSSRNAPEHDLRARRFVLPPGEDPELFSAFAEGIRSAYAPEDGAEQALVEMLVAAMWQAIRADRLEAELLASIPPAHPGHGCGSDLIGEPEHRASIATVLRYQTTAGTAVKRAMDGFLKHRKARRAGLIVGEDEERRADLGRPHPNPPLPKAGGRSQSDQRVEASSSPPASTTHNATPTCMNDLPACTNEPEPRPTSSAACTNEPKPQPAPPASGTSEFSACTNEPEPQPVPSAASTNEPKPPRTPSAAGTNDFPARTNEPELQPAPPASGTNEFFACTNEPEPAIPAGATSYERILRETGPQSAPAKNPITHCAKEPLSHLRPQQQFRQRP